MTVLVSGLSIPRSPLSLLSSSVVKLKSFKFNRENSATMTAKTKEEKITTFEQYIDSIIENEDLMHKICPNGMDRKSIIEFILAQKSHKSYN